MIVCIIKRLEGYAANSIYNQGRELIVLALLFSKLLYSLVLFPLVFYNSFLKR